MQSTQIKENVQQYHKCILLSEIQSCSLVLHKIIKLTAKLTRKAGARLSKSWQIDPKNANIFNKKKIQ